ncbi:keratin, type I cytoskeletal 10 isoform X2 [Drosophila santomea]|uniref:keratin, type I cytoskeletal 10 isoform X2 n=1 Tax=Drosophila santomea TaxID=129105 RepID=UPI0019533A5D|nr:keratin, type I cytoskeletal 10 isoform X2 [Drosophila santomea]
MENLQVLRLLLGLIGLILISGSVESRPGGMEFQSHYLRAITAYRRLERILPKEELRALTGIGLLNGARQAEEQMEQHLVAAIRELLFQMNLTESARVMSKIDAIEHQLSRDQRAVEILNRVMDVVSQAKDDHEFRVELREMAQQQKEEELYNQELSADLTDQPKLVERLGKLRQSILKQVPQMKNELQAKIDRALQHLLEQAGEDGVLAKAKQKVIHKRQIKKGTEQRKQQDRETEQRSMPAEMRVIKSILSEAHDLRFQEDFLENMLDQLPPRRIKIEPNSSELDDLQMNVKSPNVTAKAKGKPKMNAKPEKQVEVEDTGSSSELATDDNDDLGDGEEPGAGGDGGGGGGGGLVGIIGSLSGGEGGSDVGALIGALTGVISTLFGPGGLDVQGLIQTGTSLISGLLGGNKNFGLVLGQYVGTALDGLSGGGGADPEEEGPPQPLTFTKNLITSFLEAKYRPLNEDGSEERHGSAELPRPRKKKEGGGWAAAAADHFDSGGFVKQVASHLVSNALGLILNAGLGAAGGASSAAKNIFASSSMGHHAKPADHHRSWNLYDNEPF